MRIETETALRTFSKDTGRAMSEIIEDALSQYLKSYHTPRAKSTPEIVAEAMQSGHGQPVPKRTSDKKLNMPFDL